MGLLYRSGKEKWVKVPEARYEAEKELHELLLRQPDILPLGDLAESDAETLIAVGSEVLLGSGYADAVFVDQLGRVTLVEVKLLRNPEARREVVAQALSYAAYLEGMTVEEFTDTVWRPFARQVYPKGIAELEMDEGISSVSGVAVDREAFMSGLAASLRAGDFRILIVMDEPHPQLRRSVAYLNRHASFDLYLVEVGYFRSAEGEHQILNPRILDSAKPPDPGGTRRPRWTIDDFVAASERENPGAAGTMRSLVDALLELRRDGTVELGLGTGVTAPSLKVQVPGVGKSILWVWPSGVIQFPTYTLGPLGVPSESIGRWMDRIAEVGGVLPEAYRGRPEPRVASREAFGEAVAQRVLEVVKEASDLVRSISRSG